MRRITCLLIIATCLTADASQSALDRRRATDLYGQKEYEACLALLEAELATNPDHRFAVHMAGRVLVDLGRHAEARPYLERSRDWPGARTWQYAWSVYCLGLVEWAAADREAARAIWSDATVNYQTEEVSGSADVQLKLTGLARVYADWPTRSTEHLFLRFSPRLADRDLDAFAAAGEAAYRQLHDTFAGGPDRVVDCIVWADAAESRQVAAIQKPDSAQPEMWLVHTTLDAPVGRRLAPVIVHHAVNPRLKTRLVTEGLGLAFAHDPDDLVAAARAALAAAGQTELDLPAWWQDGNAVATDVFDPVAGAWLALVRDRGGLASLRRLCREQSYAKARQIYGAERLNQWLADFSAQVLPR